MRALLITIATGALVSACCTPAQVGGPAAPVQPAEPTDTGGTGGGGMTGGGNTGSGGEGMTRTTTRTTTTETTARRYGGEPGDTEDWEGGRERIAGESTTRMLPIGPHTFLEGSVMTGSEKICQYSNRGEPAEIVVEPFRLCPATLDEVEAAGGLQPSD